jgi:hypothetical protein
MDVRHHVHGRCMQPIATYHTYRAKQVFPLPFSLEPCTHLCTKHISFGWYGVVWLVRCGVVVAYWHMQPMQNADLLICICKLSKLGVNGDLNFNKSTCMHAHVSRIEPPSHPHLSLSLSLSLSPLSLFLHQGCGSWR